MPRSWRFYAFLVAGVVFAVGGATEVLEDANGTSAAFVVIGLLDLAIAAQVWKKEMRPTLTSDQSPHRARLHSSANQKN